MAAKRDLVSMLDVRDDLVGLLELVGKIKNRTEAGDPYEPLRGKSLAMIFEKASTRTRVSFEVGMTQLGGHALFLSPNDTQVGRGETIADTARVLSRYVDGIMYRAFRRESVRELAANATVPVINGLDDKEHPCQIISDLFTIQERKRSLSGLKLGYIGDGNNVCNSLLLGTAIVGMHMSAACPEGHEQDAASNAIQWRPRRTPISCTRTCGCRWGRRRNARKGSAPSRRTRSTRSSSKPRRRMPS